MKLIFCPSCQDVRKLKRIDTFCECGKSSGKYVDNLNAEISGLATPLGFNNLSFVLALRNQPETGMGANFSAFVIPVKCPTVRQV